jgi:hypothetical protein
MRRAAALATVAFAGMPIACGAGTTAVTSSPRASTAAAPCAHVVRAELVAVARRIYAQGAHGRNEVSAVRRLARSARLGRAVAARDPRAVRAALAGLLKHQITRIDVTAGARTLARVGSAPAYAPVGGTIRSGGRVVGRYVLAVSEDRAFAGLVHSLTAATVRFDRGAGSGAAFAATPFPSGHATISLALPRLPPSLCGRTAADTRLNTIGYVARNVMAGEAHGAAVARTLHHAAIDPALRSAVAAGDPAALRAAIVGLFRDNRFHIVRVRAWRGTHLIGDVGGPYVLSPATGTIVGAGGAVAGRFMLAVQDDTGFIKLVHRFTGAGVVLHTSTGSVPGSTLSPGPAFVPGLSTVSYRGVAYRAYGFVGTAFPSGRLEVTLLVR